MNRLILLLRNDDKRGLHIERLFSDGSQCPDGKFGMNVPWTQVNDADERFVLGYDQCAKVTVVSQDHTAIGICYAE